MEPAPSDASEPSGTVSERRRRPWGRWTLGAVFVVAGVAHLVRPDVYLTAMPDWLPAPYVLILVSGVAEIAGGVGLLQPRPGLRKAVGWGLALLLVAVYPANVEWALDQPETTALWLRLPLQGALVAWVLRASRAVRVYSRSSRAAASAA